MPTPAFRAAHRLPRFAVFVDRNALLTEPDPGLSAVDRYYVGDSSSRLRLDPHFQFEYTPTAQSYVALGDAIDPDGVASAVLHWAILPGDFIAIRRAVLLFCGLLNQRGLARARLKPSYQTEDWSEVDLSYCNHHVGTTPMGATPRDGVLDPNGRVWGIANLYAAGSSAFPNSDCINPTLTIVALAGRLAAHLKAGAT
jgi:choline dehydrogenase-like flavoprotein